MEGKMKVAVMNGIGKMDLIERLYSGTTICIRS